MPFENKPLVSVCMISYNVEAYIADAIEGVLAQESSFPVELVIGDDASTDRTLEIARSYADRYPGRVRILAFSENHGIAGNTARTLEECKTPYVAICDSDDVWSDPHKLQKQVDFLEAHPDYGIVYTDVQTISETGAPFDDPEIQSLRPLFASGDIFFQLLGGNFIPNSSAVFRRAYFEGHEVNPYRHYFIQDYIMWLYIAARSKAHFLPEITTLYRKHSGGVTREVPPEKRAGNRRMLLLSLYRTFAVFDRHNRRPLTRGERALLLRKMGGLLLKGPGGWGEKLRLAWMLPRYFLRNKELT